MRTLIFVLVTASMATAFGSDLDESIFGEIKARNIGPATMSGRITCIDSPQGQPNVFYIGTAGGGVWKSEDGAINFKSVFDDYNQSIGCLTVDPQNPGTIWVGTGEINTRNSVSYGDGLYKSEDGGKSWKHLGFEDSERIAAIKVHPSNSKVVYVAVQGHLWDDSEERGLYKTEDGGDTWNRIQYVDEKTGCIDVDLDPQEPDTVYAAFWQVRRWPWFFESGGPGSALFKSTDGGKNWEKLKTGLPEGDLGRIDLDIAQSRPNRIYAIVEAGDNQTGLYRSDDTGHSWERVNNSFNVKARPFYLSTVKIDPQDYNRVYNPSYQLAYSKDGGKSFPISVSFGSGVHPDHQAIWINPDNPNHVVIGTDGGVYVSHDRADNFNFVATLPVSQFYHVTVDEEIPYNVYGGLQDNGSWFGPSAAPGGGIGNEAWLNVGGGDGFCVHRDREDSRYVYWESQGGNLNRLDLKAKENKTIKPYPEGGMEKNRFNWNSPLVASPTNPKTIYFGSQYLFRSMDHGETWDRISPDLTTDDPEKQRQEESGGLTEDATSAENHCTIFTISESPLDENIVWAGTDDGNVQVTRDGGENWTNVTANISGLPANTWCSQVWASSHDKATVYATFDGHRTGDKTPYVYKSSDFGNQWQALATSDIKGHAHVIRQDPVNPQLLFLGTENGLFASFDDGGQWLHFRGGLPPVSIRQMTYGPDQDDLVLATHGRGIYIIDNMTPLRNLTSEILNQKVALLQSKPAHALSQGVNLGNFNAGSFSAPNPEEGVTITYFLQKRHIFGDLYIEIFDLDGNLVQKVSGGKRKGLNRAFWKMRQKPPKIARSSALSFGATFGPLSKEGQYKAVLTKGKQKYETTVEILPSKLNPHPKADRDLQYKTVMSLYTMLENMAFLSSQVNDLNKQIENRLESANKNRLKKKLESKKAALEELANSIVTDTSSIFVDKARLREEVSGLYSAVAGYGGAPSNNQLDQLKVLEGKMADLEKDAANVTGIESLNGDLEKAKMKTLTLLTREAWEKEEEKNSGNFSYEDYKTFAKRFAPYLFPGVLAAPRFQ